MFHEDFEWQGLEKYSFARFGSAIADVGDLDDNRYNDVAVGAPLEDNNKGAVYIYLGDSERGIQDTISQVR